MKKSEKGSVLITLFEKFFGFNLSFFTWETGEICAPFERLNVSREVNFEISKLSSSHSGLKLNLISFLNSNPQKRISTSFPCALILWKGSTSSSALSSAKRRKSFSFWARREFWPVIVAKEITLNSPKASSVSEKRNFNLAPPVKEKPNRSWE